VDADRGILERARAGEFKAFDALVTKYQNRVYSLAVRITGRPEDAEEVVQGTFLSVMEHLKDFRGDALFSTWIYRIAANQALKLVRNRGRRAELIDDSDQEETFKDLPLPETAAPWTANPEVLAGRDETRKFLNEALSQLDEKHRAVFLLRDLEGLSTEETAETLSLSGGNVKVRLMRARLTLRELLTRKFGDAEASLTAHDHHD
jgi:RNA polymerase sigma-70 factor, ECF subfamily